MAKAKPPTKKPKPRPSVGKLLVPFVVDERQSPVRFNVLHLGRVDACAKDNKCAVCGGSMDRGPYAFVGPDDGRRCFADPWMHPDCARLAMEQCPFLGGRDWRDESSRQDPAIHVYSQNMQLFIAPLGRAHRQGGWHFEALGELRRAGKPRT